MRGVDAQTLCVTTASFLYRLNAKRIARNETLHLLPQGNLQLISEGSQLAQVFRDGTSPWFDGEFHFFEFDIPDEWGIDQRIGFKWQLAHKVTGLVFCRCERWLDEAAEGQVGRLVCRSCGTEYMFCLYCDAVSEWAGCDCDKDESSSCDTHPADE